MSKSKIVQNVCSNWANLAVTVLIAFLVSPITVRGLGKEMYGVWTLIMSVTGYFTVLDFGVNTAIVRYISSSVAKKEFGQARKVYSTSAAIFGVMGGAVLVFSLVFGFFFQDIFGLQHISRLYLYGVFLVSALDFALGLYFSVYLGSMCALQEYQYVNATSIGVNLVKSVLIVVLLKGGYGLLALAACQFSATCARAFFQRIRMTRAYSFLTFSRADVSRESLSLIYSYSVYSFVIAIALKLLYYTDSVVIGSFIGVAEITFFAIPSTLLEYLDKLVWSMMGVLVPVVSSNDSTGADNANVRLYRVGTKYSLLLSLPIVISLYFYGSDFISLWMGPEFGPRSKWVLRFLLIGYALSFTQASAHAILKGMSRHKILSYILAVEAIANLGISLALAKRYGIEGVAIGTMVPLVIATVGIMIYTCRVLRIGFFDYAARSYLASLLVGGGVALLVWWADRPVQSYLDLILAGSAICLCYLVLALPLMVERDHREYLMQKVKTLCGAA